MNWAYIRTPQVYEDLIGTLLSFEYIDFRRYSRPGRDAGIDGQRQDGRSIWQFKFHSTPSMAQVSRDTRLELQGIIANRDPKSPNYSLWRDCTEWTLVTNIDLNPQMETEWFAEFGPAFRAIGIEPRFWGNAQIEPLLIKHRQIADYYFEGKNRCFLSLQEAEAEEGIVQFGKLRLTTEFIGREQELKSVESFLNGEDNLLLIHGAGAIGKSRLLLETGRMAAAIGFHPLWANVSTMANTDSWLQTFQNYDQAILLIDEPTDPDLIETLSEQYRSGNRLKKWKFVIAARSPKDPILEAARSSIMKRVEFALDPLGFSQACQVAAALLEQTAIRDRPPEEKQKFAEQIARAADRFPGWIVLAIETLQGGDALADLPTSHEELAGRYLNEVIRQDTTSHVSAASLFEVLRWIALVQRLDLENSTLLDFLSKKASLGNVGQLEDCIRSLTARRVLSVRGIKKQYRLIKPDVIRDHILRIWLVDSTGDHPRPSAAARDLVSSLLAGHEGKALPEMPQLLKALAQLDLRENLMHRPVDLLGPLFDELEAEAVRGDSAHQFNLLGVLGNFAFARADRTIAICRLLRLNPRPPSIQESILGPRTINHYSVLREIPWLLFETARYIRDETQQRNLLLELCELLKLESADTERRHNDGKGASSLIPRIISSQSEVIASYEIVGFNLASDFLDRLAGAELSAGDLLVADTLVKHYISVQREDTAFEGNQFTMRRWFIGLNSPQWQRREVTLGKLRNLAVSSPDEQVRFKAIHLINESSHHASRALTETNAQEERFAAFRAGIQESILFDLRWVLDIITRSQLSFREMSAYRSLWSWFSEYGPPSPMKDVALECEAIYQRHPSVVAYGAIFGTSDYEEAVVAAKAKGEELAQASNTNVIEQFFKGAEDYLKVENHSGNLGIVANSLGQKWSDFEVVREFCLEALKPQKGTFLNQIGTFVLGPELKRLRDLPNDAALTALLDQVVGVGATPQAKAWMVKQLYFRAYPDFTGLLRDKDCLILASAIEDINLPLAWAERFVLCSTYSIVRPAAALEVASRLWALAPADSKAECLAAFADSTGSLFHFTRRDPRCAVRPETFNWMVDRLVEMPDLEAIYENVWYHFKEMAQVMPKRPLAWLNDVLAERIVASGDESNSFKPLTTRRRLTAFCETVTPQTAKDPQVRAQMERLLSLSTRKGLIGYLLPDFAVRTDPEGVLIPILIAEKITNAPAADEDLLHTWVRFAGYYPTNSPAWRVIAAAAIEKVAGLPLSERGRHYAALLEAGIKSSSYAVGQMDPAPIESLKARKEELAQESDPRFIPFREWHRDVAQEEYNRALAEFQEEQTNALD